MQPPHGDLDTLVTFWETLGLSDRKVELGRTATMRPPERRSDHLIADQTASETLPQLPHLLKNSEQNTLPEVELGELIGRGGMGQVRLATQLPVGRQVAVKSLLDQARSDESTMVLLREGWITGMLEHPNIVPIYTLGRNDDGAPMIVMKHVEGVSWAELIRDPTKAPRRFDSDEPLDWHLGILSQVCNAVHFAHTKGIIHRDIKPENVMIGAFGEVYLLDWGIAVSVSQETSPKLPRASDIAGPVGTPQYMAPEMATAESEKIGAATDVYLLGATLHEILTGEPPHHGETLFKVLAQALKTDPRDYPDDVPEPLAAICRKAMAPAPRDRHDTADALRVALAEYSRQRESLRLTDVAQDRLETLMDAQIESTNDASVGDQQAALYKVFGECRFGFEQALQIDPDNDQARSGLQQVLELMAERELERGAYQAASLLLADLPHQRPALDSRLAALRSQLDDREEEFEELKREQFEFNVEIARHTRSIVALLLGLAWGSLSVYRWWQPSASTPSGDYSLYLIELGVVSVLFGLSLWFGREALLKNTINRRILACFGIAFLGSWGLRVNSMSASLPAHVTGIHETLLFGVGTGIMAVTLDSRIWWGAVPYVAGSLLALLVPQYTQLLWGVTNYVSFGLLAWAWWPRKQQAGPTT
jgi:serine/threonine-protein kinase